MEQKIVVRTKGQLLAAFECAINHNLAQDYLFPIHSRDRYRSYFLKTHITLIRKTGITIFELKHLSYDHHGIKKIRKMKRILRRIPAKELIQ